ncbi:hypothetical protein P7C70_g6804, partial [Phenoliferia sp. Uapishka_3]
MTNRASEGPRSNRLSEILEAVTLDRSLPSAPLMSVLDAPVHSLSEIKAMYDALDSDDQERMPDLHLKVSGNFEVHQWYSPSIQTPWCAYSTPLVLSQHRLPPLRERQRRNVRSYRMVKGGYVGHPERDYDQYLAALEDEEHLEVSMLQQGLITDHQKLISHDLAAFVISNSRQDARREFIITLKNKINQLPSLPTLGDLRVIIPESLGAAPRVPTTPTNV